MNDMRTVIIPKSDQLNADDLLGGPRTITITRVEIRPGTEQPVSIYFEGDNGKPWKTCKSMNRVLVQCWGADASKYVGRSVTIYCDPKVMWGGMAVGGIRISHMSDIDGKQTMALTATKGSRKPFTVLPLAAQKTTAEPPQKTETAKRPSIAEWFTALQTTLDAADSEDAVHAISARDDVKSALTKLTGDNLVRLNTMLKAALDRFAAPTDPAPLDEEAAF